MDHLLSLVLLAPLSGLVVLSWRLVRREWSRLVAACSTVAAFVAALSLWRLPAGGSDYDLIERVVLAPGLPAAYVVGVDGYGALLVLCTTMIAVVAAGATWPCAKKDEASYAAGLLLVELGTVGMFMSLDLLLFAAFWAVMLLGIARLLASVSGTRAGEARWAMASALGGAAGVFMAAFLAARQYQAEYGSGTFDVVLLQNAAFSFDRQLPIFAAAAAAVVLSGLFPLAAYRTSAEPRAALGPDKADEGSGAAASKSALPLVLALVVASVALFTFVRASMPIVPDVARTIAPAAGILCLIGAAVSATIAFRQREWTRVVACAALAQLGVMAFGVFTVNPTGVLGGVRQHVTHAMTTATLLLLAGAFTRQDPAGIERGSRLTARGVLVALVVLLAILSFAGVPPLSGFAGVRLIVQGARRSGTVWAIGAVAALALSAGALLSRYVLTMRRAQGRLDGVRGRELALVVPLLALAVWVGLRPAALLDRLTPSRNRAVVRVSPQYAAECDTTVTPEMKASIPGAQFLDAAPCGPDGEPLTAAPSR